MAKIDSKKIIKEIGTLSSKKWLEIGEKRKLNLFHAAAERVPAYKDFLKKNKIDHRKIKNSSDFLKVPLTNKKDYLRAYSMRDLCWDGVLDKAFVFSATSGSTGKPFYFPHENELDEEYSVLTELFLQNSNPQHKPTLVIICFAMGVWIGGLFTYQAFQLASLRGKNISIITPGISKDEILNALRNLSPSFAQTIIVGYPPFVKDVLDDALISGINLPKLNIRLLFAAESFSEIFRDHLAKSSGIKNVFRDTLNIYGTADIGAMAFETPTSILIRRLTVSNKKLFSKLFGNTTKTPTFAQYNPYFTNFEAPDGEVVLTGNNAIPLLRYAVGDRGGVASISDVVNETGIDLPALQAESKKHDAPIYNLPFVYVFERSDFSVKLYGATIYSEHVKEALQDSILSKSITGKFSMQTLTDKMHNQYLELNVELKPDVKSSQLLTQRITKMVVENLLKKNSEYQNNHTSMKDKVFPKIVFWGYEDPTYFKPGVKQKWVKKEVLASNQ